MTPSTRTLAAIIVVTFVGAYFQLSAFNYARSSHIRVAPFSSLMARLEADLAASAHRDLYASGQRFEFVYACQPKKDSSAVAQTVYYAYQRALIPAVLVMTRCERVLVFAETPQEFVAFEAANRVRLLDVLNEQLRAYEREAN